MLSNIILMIGYWNYLLLPKSLLFLAYYSLSTLFFPRIVSPSLYLRNYICP